MSARNSLSELRSVIGTGLCTRCGSCVGLSEGRARFDDKEGRYLPVIDPRIDVNTADRMWGGCSGREVDFLALNRHVFGVADRHPYIGHFTVLGISYCADPCLRRQCASGGVLTRTLIWLLRRHEIQGAVVTGMDAEKPWRPRSFIATTEQEIVSAAQSKYVITSVNELLPQMETFDGNLAYVGLPCQVHSIRKLQMAGDRAVGRVKYVLGPYCGNTLHFSSIVDLLRSYGEADHRQIVYLAFREGEWPGHTCIDLRSGRRITLEKFHANYLIPFHIMKRCLLCTDLANEFTDISGGDAWSPHYEDRGKGFSVAIARSREGTRILNEMIAEGVLSFEKLSQDDVLAMHSHGYDLKKHGAFIRLRFRRLAGRTVPDYGYRIAGMRASRYVMEVLIDMMFAFAATRPVRYIIRQVKPEWMGRMFKAARVLWKRLTYRTKRADLPN